MHALVHKTRRKLRLALMAVLAVIVAGAIGFGVYVGDYYHADDAALAAMESTDIVAVQRLEDGARDLLLEAHPTADEIAGVFL